MLEVVFSDSEKGSVNAAQHYVKKNMLRSKDVVDIGFMLDVGDISGEAGGHGRQAVFESLWGMHDFSDKDREEFFQYKYRDEQKLLTAARQGESIRIWVSSTPYSMCGYYYTCHLLREIDCDMRVIVLPPFIPHETEDATVSYSHWGEVKPDKFYSFLPFEKDLPPCEKLALGNHWCDLIKENAPLRALVSGQLLSVPEDFYDHILLRNIPDGDFKMIWLVGTVMGKYPLGVSDSWYVSRLRAMIRDGDFAVVGNVDEPHPYGEVLRKINR